MVCHGNICRSPMAAGFFAKSMKGIEFHSAGLQAQDGIPADPHALEVCSAEGIDISHHRARTVDESILRRSDLLLAMEEAHVLHLKSRFPWATGRIWRLGHHQGADFPDIFGKPRDAFVQFLHCCSRSFADWEPVLRS